MNFLKNCARALSARARRRRAEYFCDVFEVTANTKILDLGSGDGSAIAAVLKNAPVAKENVFIADIDQIALERGNKNYGFVGVLLTEAGKLPFPDRFFDIVYCSSVIEHVTTPKLDVWRIHSGSQFKQRARVRQRAFADEIRRVGRQYFVQTPNALFPVESHSWLPLVGYLPRRALVPLLRCTNTVWIKRTSPDWCLLRRREMRDFFPESRIINERFLGLTKSFMAVLSDRAHSA
jgi:SAM-dependent methyltransferase